MSKRNTKFNSSNSLLPINEQIRSSEVVLIDDSNGTRTTMPTATALIQAKEQELDLVLVAPKAVPPVAKILDYGKYKYEQARKDRKRQSVKKGGEIKEIRLSVRMEDNDVNQRLNQAKRFLAQGHHILVSLRFHGRENIFRNKGIDVLNDFAQKLNLEFASQPRFAGTIVNVQLKTKHETKDQSEQS